MQCGYNSQLLFRETKVSVTLDECSKQRISY